MAKKSKKTPQEEWDIGEEILCPACKNLKFDVQKVDAEKNRITLKCIACGTVFSKACNCQKSKMVAERVPPTPKKRTQNTRKRNTVAKKVSQVRAEEKKKIAKGEKIKKIGPLKDPQQEMFCQQCVVASSPTEAARQAGYSKERARIQASELVTKSNIRQRIKEIMDEQLDDVIANKRRAIMLLWERATANLADYLTKGADGMTFIEFAKELPNPRAVKKLKVKQIFDDNGNMTGMIDEIELHDQVAAIKELADMEGWNAPEEIKHGGTIILEHNVPEPGE